MRVTVAAVGKLKSGPERSLYEHYCDRFDGVGRNIGLGPVVPLEIVESRGATASQRQAAEAEALLSKVPADAELFVLDETGKALTSREFAGRIGSLRDAGSASLAFLVGGPDGHGDILSGRKGMRLSLGSLTLPHGLARVVLAEQLYRAATILAGHPYHRD